MPYIKKTFEIKESIRVEDFLLNNTSLDIHTIHSLLAKGKITDNKNRRLQKNQEIKNTSIHLSVFEAITKGLKPLFYNTHFAIFDKASGIKVHPSSINEEYTLLDEIQYHFGKTASLAHRIDQETSGLVLVSLNIYSQMILKNMFEEKEYTKKYLALVHNEVKEDFIIDKKITNDTGLIKLKMKTSSEGKDSITKIKLLSYNKKTNQSLVQAQPITGRQHQIRVHLESCNHAIIGDPIYGISENDCNDILNRNVSEQQRVKITGEKRLMLQANYLEFTFEGILYKFTSKQKLL